LAEIEESYLEKGQEEKRKNKPEKLLPTSNIKTDFYLMSNGARALSESVLSPFIPLFGQYLGASSPQIGFITSITSLLSIFQIIWAAIAQKLKLTRVIAVISYYGSTVFTFLLLPIKNIFTFAALRGSQSIIISGMLPTSSSIMAERVSPKSYGLINSLLQGVLVLGTAVGTIIGGAILWKLPIELSFTIIFITSDIISIVAAVFFHISIPSKKRLEAKGRWQYIEEVDLGFNNVLAIMKTDRNYVLFCLFNFIFIFGVNLAGPFFIIFNTTHYDLTIFETALLSSIGLIPQVFASFATAQLTKKARKKELAIVAGIFTSFFPIFYMIPSLFGKLTGVFWILIIIWSTNGIAWGIINSSMTILLLDIIHPRRRTLQLAISNSISSLGLFLAPIIGGIIIDHSATIYLVLLISAVIRFVGISLFVFIKEPIIGGTILRPLSRIIPVIIRSNAEKGVTIITAFTPQKIVRRINQRKKRKREIK
jgi:MFS family permease